MVHIELFDVLSIELHSQAMQCLKARTLPYKTIIKDLAIKSDLKKTLWSQSTNVREVS